MDILFLIHPNFVIENWFSNPDKLESYYDDVINYVNNFNGITIVHLMNAYLSRDRNQKSWELHDKFVSDIKSASDVVKWERTKLGCTFGNEFDDLLLKYRPKRILIGGGYHGLCLRETYNELYKQYGSYLKDIGTKIHKVSSLIYIPGTNPHRLSDTDLDEYQREYTDKQSGRNDAGEYKWENMPEGESFEVTEDTEIILDRQRFLLEEGGRITIKSI